MIGIILQTGAEGTLALDTAMAEGRWQAPLGIEHTVGWEAGINLRQTFPPGTFVPPMTKLEEVAVVMFEGEDWLKFFLSSAWTVLEQDPPRLILSSGKVSLTKCQNHCVVVGLSCSQN